MRKYKIPVIILIFVNIILLALGGFYLTKYLISIKQNNENITISSDSQAETSQIPTSQAPTSETVTEQTAMPENKKVENSPNSVKVNSSATVKKLLETALKPVGNTMYVYGGGWNKEDTGAGEAAVTIGVSPQWKAFADAQDKNYDSSQYRYQIEKGLDCSGYLGWVIYNTLETENGKQGYVFFAQEFSDKLSQMGLGVKTEKPFSDYLPGDILSSSSDHHVWLSLGQCDDGSVVFVHSSPPGVSICGTATPDGTERSEAVKIAEKFMKEQYPNWYARYPRCSRNTSYLQNYSRFRWNVGTVLTDPDDYLLLSPEEILTDLFMG